MAEYVVEFLKHIRLLEQLYQHKAQLTEDDRQRQHALGCAQGLKLAFEAMQIVLEPAEGEEPVMVKIERVAKDAT